MTSMITARVDSEKRTRAEKVFDEVGLTTSAAVNLFICAVAMSGGIPFPIGVRNAVSCSEPMRNRAAGVKLGIADGKYRFTETFDKDFDAMDDEVAELFA